MAWLGVVTNAGKELLGGWLAGQTLQITRATGGSGTVREAALLAQTELVEQQQAASIVSYKTVEGGSKIKLQFPAAEAAYQLNQIGIWGNVGGADVLLALFQNAEGVLISSRAEFPDFAYTFYAVLAIGNEAALAVTVDAEAWVTIKTLQEVLADYVKVNAEGKIPDAVLPPMDYIPKTEKNAAGGVAGLDANRKIVLAQLPVDEALSANSGNPVQNKVINAALAGKVPTGRKVNGKALTGDISLTAADVGAAASGHSHTAAQVGAAASNHTHTAEQVGALASNGKAATAGTADTAKACSGNAATATKLATARSIRTNLASGSAVNFDGSGNITPGVYGVLSVANGGTGSSAGLAISKIAKGSFNYPANTPLNLSLPFGFLPVVLFISVNGQPYLGNQLKMIGAPFGLTVLNTVGSKMTVKTTGLLNVDYSLPVTIILDSQKTTIADTETSASQAIPFYYVALG
jgi:hypothetical protein